MIVGITGAVGTGKTSLSRLFAEKEGFYYLSLKDLAKEEALLENYDEEYEAYEIDLEKLKEALEKKLEELKKKGVENIIIESHLLVELPLSLDKLIILRTKPSELEKRLKERGYKEEKIRENLLTEALDYFPLTALENYEEEKIIELNLTGLTIDEALELLKKAIKGEVKKTSYSFPEDLKDLALKSK